MFEFSHRSPENRKSSKLTMISTEKMQSQKMGSRDYIEALEEERRKIEVFQRELPLCLELVTQGIISIHNYITF